MGSLFFRKCLAWLAVAFFLLMLPTFGHANIALTGKSFQSVIQNSPVGYELTMAPSGYTNTGATYYNMSFKPSYYDPYLPQATRTLEAVADAPVKYPTKVKVKDLLSTKNINGKTTLVVPAEGVSTGMTCAAGIAKKAITGLPGVMISELVFPESLADGTIKASGYEFGKISDAADSDITATDMAARIAQNNGIDTSGVSYTFPPPSGDSIPYTGENPVLPALNTPTVSKDGQKAYVESVSNPIQYTSVSSPSGPPPTTRWWNNNIKYTYTYYKHYGTGSMYEKWMVSVNLILGSSPNPPPAGFDPANYPDLYFGSQGTFNAIADLVSNDAEVELIPLDPSLMPTWFPDGDTGFMRFSGKTTIDNKDYLIGPNNSLVEKPEGVTTTGLPYVDPSSIGLTIDPLQPGGQSSVTGQTITGIPPGSTIISVDPQTGLIKFRTPDGYESSKFGTVAEIQTIQTASSSPYLGVDGKPINYGGSSSSNSTTTVISDREDYSVNVPGIPDVPPFASTFDVPEPEPWPWQTWVSNPIKTILDNMQITASGSPLLNFPINFPWYQPINLTVDFSEYETEIASIGGYMVALAYIMAVLIVVRAKN